MKINNRRIEEMKNKSTGKIMKIKKIKKKQKIN